MALIWRVIKPSTGILKGYALGMNQTVCFFEKKNNRSWPDAHLGGWVERV